MATAGETSPSSEVAKMLAKKSPAIIMPREATSLEAMRPMQKSPASYSTVQREKRIASYLETFSRVSSMGFSSPLFMFIIIILKGRIMSRKV